MSAPGGRRRATIVQVKRKAHEAAASSLYIETKRAKRLPEVADGAAQPAPLPTNTDTSEPGRGDERVQGDQGEAGTEGGAGGRRHVFRRIESLCQADIDKGRHLELLVRAAREGRRKGEQRAVRQRL